MGRIAAEAKRPDAKAAATFRLFTEFARARSLRAQATASTVADDIGRSVSPSFHCPSTMSVVACCGSPRSCRSTMLIKLSTARAPIIVPFW